jgi:hypothetical protein
MPLSPGDKLGHPDVAPDGRFLINVESSGGVTNPIHVLLNWKPPAK